MKKFSVALILTIVFQSSAMARDNHAPVTEDTVIRIAEGSAHSPFYDLLAISFDNLIPLGITMGDKEVACQGSLGLQPGTVTVAELIAAIEAAQPHYRAELQNGVLEVAPASPSENTNQFLAMTLNHFQSDTGNHNDLGRALWQSIRAVLAPGEGSNRSHLVTLSTETVMGLEVSNGTVKSILDMIVRRGNGGAWILHTPQVKTLSPDTPMPYEIQGYGGQPRSFISNLACNAGQQRSEQRPTTTNVTEQAN